MTQGDYIEMTLTAMLYGLAFTLPLPRWRFFWSLNVMAVNMLAGRVFILAYGDQAYILCSLLQLLAAVIFIVVAETAMGVLTGLLFASMVVGGGLTGLGTLSPNKGIGLSLSYWSVMSIATYLQFVILSLHVFVQWQKHGLAGRNRLGRG